MPPAVTFDDTVLAAALDAFGEPVTYLPAGGGQVALVAIWTQASKEMNFRDGEPVLDELPTLGCREMDVAAEPVAGELFIIRGNTWAVARVGNDSLGGLKLHLHGPI